MTERILVAVAWPYANGSIHLGQVAGAYLPADIFARYHRLKGNQVLMVSGSDAHGTPVTLTAESQGVTPETIASKYQSEFVDNWKRLGIDFDLFTTTHTQNHASVAQDIFLTLYKKGHIYKDSMLQPYCDGEGRFLADRYVEGTCPHCNYENARGDQCDNCGRTLDPEELGDMRCKICGDSPVIKETEHFFLKLSIFEEQLITWIREQDHWRPNVKNFSIGYLEGGLHDRAITRDIEWGVPVPLPGYESKRIYVWFEAVIGYLSAVKEASQNIDNPDLWREFWQNDSKSYYFMGKDNIPFHTVIWPAMLIGYGGLNLPYDVPANEYLNLEGMQFSTSRNWAVWLPDYLDKYEPDPIRYVLASHMPETSDSDFSWKEYVRSNNEELVATYGNLINRVLALVYKNFDHSIPKPATLEDIDLALLENAECQLTNVAQDIELCHFRSALQSGMALARETNKYLETQAPWRTIKSDRAKASTTLWVAMSVVNCLKTIMYPFIPFSSKTLHEMLGFSYDLETDGWKWDRNQLKPGNPIPQPRPLFTKLDESLVDSESQDSQQ
tara:strand:- start:10706 stop:12373 length:1668 start_codon:yes stop_codon:yes gene_type:complete